MKRKYIELPAEYLFLKIMKIIYMMQNNEKKSEKLRKDIGLNEKQVKYLFSTDTEEIIKNPIELRTKLLSLENKKVDIKKIKLDGDSDYIFKSFLEGLLVYIFILIFSIFIFCLAIFDTGGRNEFNINSLKIFSVICFSISHLFLFSSVKYFKLHLSLKKDIMNNDIKKIKTKKITYIKTMKKYNGSKYYNSIGIIFYVKEGKKIKKYYLFMRDKALYILDRHKLKELYYTNFELQFFNKSRYVISCSNFDYIVKAFSN